MVEVRYTKKVMLLSRRQNKRRDISLIFDIGSSSIGGAIIRYSDDSLPEILFTVRKDIDLSQNFNFDQFFNSMIRSLEIVAVDALAALTDSLEEVAGSLDESGRRVLGRRVQNRIKNIYCVFGLPWYRPSIEDIHEEFEDNRLVTSEMVLQMIKNAATRARESFVTPEAIGVLEEKVLEYRLNGYRLEAPTYSNARTVDLKLYLSTVSKSTMRSIRSPIRKALPFRRVSAASFLMAYFSVMRDMYPDKNTFVIFNVSGEVSELSIVEDDILTKTISVPRGKSTLIREIANSLNIELFEAASRLSLYSLGKLEVNAHAEIEIIVEREMLVIQQRFLEKLGNTYLPQLAFVLSSEEIKPVAFRAMESIYGGDKISEIVPLATEYFKDFVTVAKPRYRDHFLSLLALYFRSFEGNG